MNSLLYNLSVVILLFGLILMVHYVTKIYYQKKVINETKGPDNVYDSYIYQERPNTLFKKMFNSLGPWIGRTANPIDEEIDPEDIRVKVVTEPLLLFQ
jgi:hypothetical protein